jgi:hypothetical protein
VTERECQVCGGSLRGKRSDATTCGDACRARKSRRKRDPGIGSPERRQRQRAGLDIKYTARQHAQARRDLQGLGLVPSEWVFDPRDGEMSPQFDGTRSDPRYTHDLPRRLGHWTRTRGGLFAAIRQPWLIFNDDPTKGLWSPGDRFPNSEVYIGFRDGGRPPKRGWHNSEPYWPRERPLRSFERDTLLRYFADGRNDIYERATDALDLDATRGAPFALSGAIRRHSVRTYGPKGKGVRFVQNEVRIVGRGKWWNSIARALPKPPKAFACKHCGETVNVKQVAAHSCVVAVTGHTPGERTSLLSPRLSNETGGRQNAQDAGQVPVRRRRAA